MNGLVDQDIKPRDQLSIDLGDRLDLEVGVENNEDALIDALEGTEILFTTSRLPVTERVLEAATDLDLVAKIGTGLDSIDLEAASDHGVTVVYTPGLNAISVAEHAIALLLAVNRNIVLGQQMLEAGGWRDSMPTSQPVAQQTVGIIGFGDIGSRVAGLLSGFQTETIVSDPYVHEIDTQITGAELVSLEELLSTADAVVVTAELTDETRGLIDEDALEMMSEDATLVNTARGPIVDQSALVDAIQEGSIAGAGLDVFETEPLPADSPLHEYDNVIVTPHIAASTITSRRDAIGMLADLTKTYLDEEELPDRFVATDSS